MLSYEEAGNNKRECARLGKRGWKAGGGALGLLAMVAAMAFPARAQSVAGAPGCGPADEHFEVKTKKEFVPAAQAETGKAVVYFLEDDRQFLAVPKPTVRSGIDGAWVGATHGNSYFSVPVEPGERHICAVWQSKMAFGAGLDSAALHFTAATGKVYYFRIKNKWSQDQRMEMKLEPMDSDEGELLVRQFAQSTSRKK